MAFVNLKGLDSVSEPKPVPEGTYTLRVVNVQTYTKEDTGRTVTKIVHEIDGHPDAAPVTLFLVHPKEDDDPGQNQRRLLDFKRYLTLAGVPFDESGFTEEDLYGATFEAYLRLGEPDQNGTQYNEIRLPRLS